MTTLTPNFFQKGIVEFNGDATTSNTITVNESKILFFSIPFDEGWSAKLNGTDVKLYRVNAGLTGLQISKGKNDVELIFEPRLRSKGKLISLISLFILFGLLGFNFFMRRKNIDL